MTDAPLQSPSGQVRDVAIVGGGAAGVLVALHLLRAPGPRPRVRLIEPRPQLGEGIAYSTPYPAHLLNVRAGNMSAFPAEPADFVRFAAKETTDDGDPPLAQRYLPRGLFARYLRAALADSSPPADLHVRDTVVDIAGDGPFTLRLGSGASLAADAVVLATGNAPRPPIADVAARVPAWDYDAVAAIGADEDVAIVGSGLSMVDVAVSLAANGHRGRIDVFSRHGLLPLAHHAHGGAHGDADALHPLGLRARLRKLRAEAAALAAEGQPWQWLMDRLRPHGRALWQSLSPVEQARFLRHAVRFWDIHRHRIAPDVAAQLDPLLHSGQLRVHAARVMAVKDAEGGVALHYRRRGEGTDVLHRADRLVDATGIETRLRAMPDSLLARLAARGCAAPGPHGLGIAVDADGHVIDAHGRAQARLRAIGTPRLGVEWETTAIPDLRVQAGAIAARLRAAG